MMQTRFAELFDDQRYTSATPYHILTIERKRKIEQQQVIMKFSILALTISAATAFAPATSTKSSTALRNELGDKSSPEMSQSLPFIARPKLLDGSMPGDVGFE